MNKRKILHGTVVIFVAAITLLVSFKRAAARTEPSEEEAVRVARAYAEAINYEYENPAAVYALMTSDYRSAISEEDFTEAFKKERSYPYLTPLFINYDRVEMADDLMTGTAWYSQAARLPGMVYEVKLVYEDGTYHVRDFEDFLDGSYLDKFDTVTYDLSSYFDTEYQGEPEE
ncbi:MAG: hypothetical protein ACI4BB_07490 [Coprococcus sp.]